VWWAPAMVQPIENAEVAEPEPAPATVVVEEEPVEEPIEEAPRSYHARSWEFGGVEHQRVWARFVRRTTKYEKDMTKVVQSLLKRQQESVQAKLNPDDPFNIEEWIKKFRVEVKPVITDIVDDSGGDALDDLAIACRST